MAHRSGLVFIDRKGIVRYVASGWDGEFEDRYVKFIEGLLAGGESAAQSR